VVTRAQAGKRKGKSAQAAPAASPSRFASLPPVWKWTLLKALVLIAAGICVYWPSLHGDFLWDDLELIKNNDAVHDPLGYWKIPLQYDTFNEYYPLTSLVEWALWQLFGDNVLPFHLTTLTLHLINALLVWALFHRLRLPFAWMGGLIFAVDPVLVESVAWISELKNTISLAPLLVSMLLFLQWEKERKPEQYRLAVVCFALSLLAKSSGIMLPLVILMYAFWRRGKLTLDDARTAAPFFAISALDAAITFFPRDIHYLAQPDWNLAAALAGIGWSIFFLLGKCVAPFALMPIYPGYYGKPAAPLDLLPWAALIVIGVLLWRAWATWGRHVAFGLGFFLLNLVPVFVYMFLHYTSMIWSMDHLIYLPVLGLIGLFLAGLGHVPKGQPAQPILCAGLAVLIALFAWQSHAYAVWWQDWRQFWRLALEANPGAWLIREAHGTVLAFEGKDEEALREFAYALQANSNKGDLYNDIADSLQKLGRTQEAENAYRESAKANPYDALPYIRLGELLEKDGRKEEAATEYEGAVKRLPDSAQLRYNLGTLYLTTGKISAALEQLRQAVALDPRIAPAHENYGSALAQSQRLPEAIEQFEAAVTLKPNYLAARGNLARALAQTGRIGEAIVNYQALLEIDPGNKEAITNLAILQKYQQEHPDASK